MGAATARRIASSSESFAGSGVDAALTAAGVAAVDLVAGRRGNTAAARGAAGIVTTAGLAATTADCGVADGVATAAVTGEPAAVATVVLTGKGMAGGGATAAAAGAERCARVRPSTPPPATATRSPLTARPMRAPRPPRLDVRAALDRLAEAEAGGATDATAGGMVTEMRDGVGGRASSGRGGLGGAATACVGCAGRAGCVVTGAAVVRSLGMLSASLARS